MLAPNFNKQGVYLVGRQQLWQMANVSLSIVILIVIIHNLLRGALYQVTVVFNRVLFRLTYNKVHKIMIFNKYIYYSIPQNVHSKLVPKIS